MYVSVETSLELLGARFWHIYKEEKYPRLKPGRNTHTEIITLGAIFSLCTAFIYQI